MPTEPKAPAGELEDLLPSDVEDDLREGYSRVVRGDAAEAAYTELRESGAAFAQHGLGEHAVLFYGDGLRVRDRVITKLTRSALAHGGHRAEALATHIAVACGKPTADDAVAHLRAVFAQPAAEYTFGEALPTVYIGDGPYPLGRCMVYGTVQAALAGDPSEAVKVVGDRFPARVITATVTAHDEESAYLRAVDAIDEAKAILYLDSVDDGRRRRSPTITLADGQLRSTSTGGESFSNGSAKTFLYPPYTHVSSAAAKEPENRTDWERRVVAAARWNYQAATSSWPTAELGSLMSALETLLVDPTAPKKNKGDRLAGSLRDLGVGPWGPPDVKFTTWFRKLYKSRNDAVHEGVTYDEDLDVSRLRTITRVAIRWAAGHLDRFHPSDHGRACTTLHEALADHH